MKDKSRIIRDRINELDIDMSENKGDSLVTLAGLHGVQEDLEDEIQAVREEIEEAKENNYREISELTSQVEKLEGEVTNLTDEIEDLKNEINDLKQSIRINSGYNP